MVVSHAKKKKVKKILDKLLIYAIAENRHSLMHTLLYCNEINDGLITILHKTVKRHFDRPRACIIINRY